MFVLFCKNILTKKVLAGGVYIQGRGNLGMQSPHYDMRYRGLDTSVNLEANFYCEDRKYGEDKFFFRMINIRLDLVGSWLHGIFFPRRIFVDSLNSPCAS